MERRNSGSRGLVRDRGLAREDLRGLLRRGWVRATLLVSAAAPVLMFIVTPPDARQPVSLAPQAAIIPAQDVPAVRSGAPEIGRAWRVGALERESRRITQKYLKLGYSISPDLARDIHEAALEHDIDPEIAFGLVRVESSFRNAATSRVGAVGLTQLMPRTAAWMEPGVSRGELRDAETNLRIGFKYLRYLLDKYEGDEDLALTAYNRGPGTVDRELRRGRDPGNGYAAFVRGEKNHGHTLFTR